jgi:hypothetical protein
MANTLTNDGEAHIVELDTPVATTEDFDAMILSRGNDATLVTDNRSAVASADECPGTLVQLVTGYPLQGDIDPRNGGADADWWTWRFDIPPGVVGFVATNLMVTNWNSGAPSATENVMVHALLATPLEKRVEQRLTVFVNVEEGSAAGTGPTIYSALDEPNAVPRMHTYTHRARALATYGSAGSQGSSTSAFPGESVRVMALLVDDEGGILAPGDVQSANVVVQSQGLNGKWSTYLTQNIGAGTVLAAVRYDDVRWPHPGGYQWAHTWEVPEGNDETAYRLRYTVRQRGGPSTVMTVEVRTGSELTGVGA